MYNILSKFSQRWRINLWIVVGLLFAQFNCNNSQPIPRHIPITENMIELAKDKNYLFLSRKLSELRDKPHETDLYEKDPTGYDATALHWAALLGDVAIVQALLERGADIEFLDQGGRTPLHIAAKNGNLGVVEFLLEHGAPVNIPDKERKTPLHKAACSTEAGPLFKVLLDKGADINVVDGEGKNVIHIIAYHTDKVDISASKQIIKSALQAGININAQANFGITALHLAVHHRDKDLVEYLLENGARTDIPDHNNQTPLNLSKRQSPPSIEIINLLEQRR